MKSNVIQMRQRLEPQFHNFDLRSTHEYVREVSRDYRLNLEMDERNRERLTEYQIRVQKYYGFYREAP